ncbi:MAG: HAD family hydrolase [Betaproteobacteria bacterium]|nr:HAD family hydrolase [Betaproteobacteria bacterium]
MQNISHLIFDLDGTLIDSSEGILGSFAGAFARCGISPVRPLASDVIGPPLMDTLAQLAGCNDSAVLRPLADAFKAHYDMEGYKLTRVFTGVPEMLRELALSHSLYIATNKRLLPTRLIIEFLGWTPYFRGIYALDFFEPPLARKADLIARILSGHKLDQLHTAYIGDRDEDRQAAGANRLQFGLATWGYGGASAPENAGQDLALDQPHTIVRLFGKP